MLKGVIGKENNLSEVHLTMHLVHVTVCVCVCVCVHVRVHVYVCGHPLYVMIRLF